MCVTRRGDRVTKCELRVESEGDLQAQLRSRQVEMAMGSLLWGWHAEPQ